LTDDATTLPLGRTAPDTLLLAMTQGELQARDPHGALGADGFGLIGLLLILRIKRLWI
jgi:hypothetical protein